MLLQMAEFHSFLYCVFYIYVACFCIMAIVNSIGMNIGVHVSFQICVFTFSSYISRSGIMVALVLIF